MFNFIRPSSANLILLGSILKELLQDGKNIHLGRTKKTIKKNQKEMNIKKGIYWVPKMHMSEDRV